MYGQYNDIQGDFQYKLTRDQGTPANADRHFIVIFAPQPVDRRQCFIYFIFHHTGLQTLSNLFANAHSIAHTDVNSRRCASWEK